MKEIVGLIPARGGSKGIPSKNIKNLAGKPLVAWTILAALDSNIFKRVIVSTEDENIARIARDWGGETPFYRPADLAHDTSSQISVVEHALNWLGENENYHPDYFCLLQPTSPLRTKEDILNAKKISESRNATAVVSVCEAIPHPYLVKTINEKGMLEDFLQIDINIDRRQDMPPAYALNGAIYLNQSNSLMKFHSFTPEGTFAYVMPIERSIDIDTPWDFKIVELILNNS